MADVRPILNDLEAESSDLDRIVSDLSDAEWKRETPAEGWTIAHQIAHLAWTDEQAVLATTDQDAFQQRLVTATENRERFVDDGAAGGARRAPKDLLVSWRSGRKALREALATLPDGVKIPWFGPPMSAASMATARIMETWAHGQDVADALCITRTPTARLRHVAHIGVRTRDFAYAVNQLPAPAAQFRVELTAPDGELWTWGPEDAGQRVTGSALDFCLLVTQRLHRDDTDLRAGGADADQWLGIAQAFAGPPGGGRKAGRIS